MGTIPFTKQSVLASLQTRNTHLVSCLKETCGVVYDQRAGVGQIVGDGFRCYGQILANEMVQAAVLLTPIRSFNRSRYEEGLNTLSTFYCEAFGQHPDIEPGFQYERRDMIDLFRLWAK